MARPIVEEVGRDTLVPLRWAVLRPGRPVEDARFAEDEERPAIHLAASHDDEVVAIGSIYMEESPHDPTGPAWRLRGMATTPALRGQGYGSAVLLRSIEIAAGHGARLFWCNARTPAVGFYEHHGLAVSGAEFDTDVGPHFYMSMLL